MGRRDKGGRVEERGRGSGEEKGGRVEEIGREVGRRGTREVGGRWGGER